MCVCVYNYLSIKVVLPVTLPQMDDWESMVVVVTIVERLLELGF